MDKRIKILLAVSCTNEWNDVRPQYGLLEITPEYAARVLETAKAVQPMLELSHFYSAEFWDCSVVYGNLPEDCDDNNPLVELSDIADEEGCALIPEGLTFVVGEKCDGSDEGFHFVSSRTESDTIVYTKSGVFYAAMDVDRLECIMLPIGLFEAVAGAAV
jgi:hypothetical protein